MPYKKITKESYDASAEEFARNVAELAPKESIQKFIGLLPANAKILDLGCGSGRDAKLFTDNNISVVGIDFSQNLLNIAKKTAPKAEFKLMDIESMTFPPSSFDGVWAALALSHIPKKTLPSVLKNIHSILKPNGHFYLTCKHGAGEGLQKDERYNNIEKFRSYYEEAELAEIIRSAKFNILECASAQCKSKYPTHPAVRIFCQKI